MMLIVQKLYIKEFLKVLVILGVGISVIFSIISLIDKTDEFLPYKPSAKLLLQYALFSIPKFINYLLPIGILLSSLFIFSQAMRRREIVAIKGAGGEMKRVLMPFLMIGVLLIVSGFGIAEGLFPQSSKKLHIIRDQIMKKGKEVTFKEGTLYMRGKDGSIVKIGLYLPDQNVSRDVSIFTFDDDGLRERIDAETATWEGSSWKLHMVQVHDIKSGMVTTERERSFSGIESPRIFQEDLWKVDEMTLRELITYQRRLSDAGFKNKKFIVDISSRLSYPLINFFMLLLGMSLSIGDISRRAFGKFLSGPHGNSGIIAAGLGLLISLVYWFGYSFTLTLGYTGTIPPLVAPWIVPLVFAAIALSLYRRIPQ